MQDLIGRNVGKYRIVARLGRGGMAEVYKAFQPTLDRYVAIKILHPFMAEDKEFLARFRREARNVAALRHPNIVQVFDFDVEDGLYYMVMEFIDGPTLKSRLETLHQRGERLPLAETLRITRDIGEALAYAHAQGIVHRDVKPANVILEATDRVILTDFGVAKILSGTQFTATGTVLGTPAYMAPEQGLGQTGDGRSDVYSLGVMLYEMATGRLPFDADTPLAVVMKHVNEPLPLPRSVSADLPEAVERVILRAMAKDPSQRYGRVDDMVAAVQTIGSGLQAPPTQPPVPPASPAARPASVAPSAPRTKSTRAMALALGGGLGLLVCVGATVVGLALLGRGGRLARWLGVAAARTTATTAPTDAPSPTRTRQPTRTLRPTEAPQPTHSPSAAPVFPEADVLFRDDFSDPASGWVRSSIAEGLTDYDDGAYRIFVDKPQSDYWANPGLTFTDVRVEVQATKAGGPDDNDFGVICRYENIDNFYAFLISSDGFYAIMKFVDGEYDFFGLDSMQSSASIHQGHATNHIRADCIGSSLRLFVNGDLLQEIEDEAYPEGDVGLIAGTFDIPGTDIRFDDFVVLSP